MGHDTKFYSGITGVRPGQSLLGIETHATRSCQVEIHVHNTKSSIFMFENQTPDV